MSLYVLDTDTLSLFNRDHPRVVARVLATDPEELALTVIQVEEVVSGWYTAIRKARGPADTAKAYQSLIDSFALLAHWRMLNYTEPAIERFRGLTSLKTGVRANDLRIATIVLEHDATLVTRNARDFSRVLGLKHENWVD